MSSGFLNPMIVMPLVTSWTETMGTPLANAQASRYEIPLWLHFPREVFTRASVLDSFSPAAGDVSAPLAFREEGEERNQVAADHMSPPQAKQPLLGLLVSFPLIRMSFPYSKSGWFWEF